MALFYETGISSSSADLMAKLKAFVEAHGWTVTACAAGWVISNGGDGFAGVNPAADHWKTCGCLGFDNTKTWENQPGSARLPSSSSTTMYHGTNIGAGPYTAYHAWVGDEDGNDHVHLVVELAAGEFRHWTMSRVVPFGTVVGGWVFDSVVAVPGVPFADDPDVQYQRYLCDANHQYQANIVSTGGDAHIWVDYDSRVNNWQAMSYGSDFGITRAIGNGRSTGLLKPQQRIGYQRYNLRPLLQPMVYAVNRASSLRSEIGRLPNARNVNMRTLFPGEEIPVGGATWKCFPAVVRQTAVVADGVKSSGLYGFAYLMP